MAPILPEEIVPGVRRLTCANPSPMTHTGTQTYLVGRGQVAVIDPGPLDYEHLGAIEAALLPGERITAVLVTHTHRDHSPLARPLAERFGAPVYGYGRHGAGMSETMRALAERHSLGGGEGADRDFTPDRHLRDGDTLDVGALRLRALHTPGHLSNHLSFALEEHGILFTGDTVMGWSTTLVSPPEGDMAAFMASLARLGTRAKAGRDRLYLPGHGAPVEDPAHLVAEQTAHRLKRAEQILTALAKGPADTPTLTRRIYTDTSPHLLPAAERNVLATLLWLTEET
ncbi:MAG: MBL fold metallo-hydrolase, partial [Pseudomonadota bacterium]